MALAKKYYTPDEYLELEREAEYKSEYIDGQVYAMTGASRAHNVITSNINRVIGTVLLNRPCEVYSADMRVNVSLSGVYVYPDVVVVCGEPYFEDREVDTLLNPTVIIEVLSPSTEPYDRGEKFTRYLQLRSLVDYVLVSQDRIRVEHYTRQGDESEEWTYATMSDLSNDVLRLASIECDVALTDIYRKVQLPER